MAESTSYNGRDPRQVILVTRDLELRRLFLMQGHLPQNEEQFEILQIPPAYQSQSDYLCALASLALMCYDFEQAFALLFCFSKLRRHALNNFFNRFINSHLHMSFLFLLYLIHLLILSLVYYIYFVVLACEINSEVHLFIAHCILVCFITYL